MQKSLQIRKAHSNELTWVNAQYASVNFIPSITSDFIAIAEINGIKVGLGRLTKVKDDVGELSGVFVLPEYRGNAIAAGIVQFLLKNNEFATLFCIPFVHLSKFYQRFGFFPTDSTSPVPEKIAEKMNWCANIYDTPITLLCWNEITNNPLWASTI